MARNTLFITDFTIANLRGAEPIIVEDASVEKVRYPGWSFDAAQSESIDLFGVCAESFDSAKDIDLVIPWLAASDTNLAHNVRWDGFLKKIVTDSAHTDLSLLNIASSHTKASVTSNLTAAGDKITTDTIVFASAGQSLGPGDLWHLRISRDIAFVDDDLTGDAYLMSWIKILEAT